ncbi:MAG: sodium/sugar symporter [Ignavibacteriaceae bacterium]
MNFSLTDYLVFFGYISLIVFTGLWVSREKKGHQKDSKDYFLASKSLPWWAIGSSLIASNISAEQFIGMSGSGFVIGLGIASYEWMAAITLILVGKFFLPIFLKEGIYTMPQFLEIRYDKRVRTSLAVFWLLVYIFVNLTSVLYLGALSIQTIMGVDMIWGILGLALFAGVYSIYGGLKAVAFTDVIQVIILIFGGLMTTVLALNAISDGNGIIAGFTQLLAKAPEKFDMILDPSNPSYKELPGLSVLIGGMWIANLFYWGCNQYITQRALAAKDIKEAQRGIMFAGYLKLILPMIVVVPGIAAYVLHQGSNTTIRPDEAYPWLLSNFVGSGFRGIAFAALVAAIVSSLSSMMNSTATIFSMDIYKPIINKNADEKQIVKMGRLTAIIAIVIAIIVAPQLKALDQAFQFIQEFTGFVSPGILSIFILGLFWKRATANSALWAAILSIPLSAAFKYLFPEMPFIDRMGVIFIILSLIVIIMSLIENRGDDPRAIKYDKSIFKTDNVFNISAIVLSAIIGVIYILFW